jgi:segregation and condensation protein B
VDGTATLETLLERQFVRVLGRKDTPGRPLLYGTTEEFLRHFGLKSVEDLPPMPQGSTEIPGLTAPDDTPAAHDTTAPAPAH